MIHIFLGTKAQYIKSAPILRILDEEGIEYNLIDSGQHADLTKELRRELGIRNPDFFLKASGDIKKFSEALNWFLRYFLSATFSPQKVFLTIFKGKKGICVIHGDTLSTLLSLYMAKRAGLKVAHIEAGLRSFNWFHPFPEELIRVIVMNFSDILFAPSDSAYANLKRMRLRGKLVNTKVNINWQSLQFSLKSAPAHFKLSNFCLVTIHRFETIFSKYRLSFIVSLLIDIAKEHKVLFILHKPTKIALTKFKLIEVLIKENNIIISDLLAHNEFIAALRDADFLITDGGSIQEESFYLGTPCLLMRIATEREEGLARNVCLSEFDKEKISYFLREFKKFKAKPESPFIESAVKIIVDELRAF